MLYALDVTPSTLVLLEGLGRSLQCFEAFERNSM